MRGNVKGQQARMCLLGKRGFRGGWRIRPGAPKEEVCTFLQRRTRCRLTEEI